MDTLIKQNPLFFAWIFPALVDASVTLIGQDKAYWINNVVNEASPAYYGLLISPWLFAAGSLIWFIGWYLIFKKLKEPTNFFFMFLFIAGHTWGSSSWIWKIIKESAWLDPTNQVSVMFGWGILIGYFVLTALIASKCLKIYLEPTRLGLEG